MFIFSSRASFKRKYHYTHPLSTAMREVIQLIQLFEYLSVACDVITMTPELKCRGFEDNQSCIVVADSKKPPEQNTSQLSTIIFGA